MALKIADFRLQICSIALLLAFAIVNHAQSRVDVRIVSDEPEAVLSILAKKKAQQLITDADWQRLFNSEGYVRLKKREQSMQRAFEDNDFKTFVLSESLAGRATELEQTLERWKKADVNRSAQLALKYLPGTATIRAKIYPSIKPRDNSFVFEVKTDPAIFMYLDPQVNKEKFENTLAHELHHIGFGTSCPSKSVEVEIEKMSKEAQSVLLWTGAFGEGFAMLAAAGGPKIHPHAVSPESDRARWDKDVANFNADLKKVDTFFRDVLAKKLTDEELNSTARSFFGVQGPWYTVGWKMSVTIESAYGRARLIEAMCDQRKLLATYNQAAQKQNKKDGTTLSLFSQQVITSSSVLK